jgi:branched-chain amino acid aminotransferase
VSSWTRLRDNSSPPRVKTTANYVNGRLASMQAKQDGYDTAILVTDAGKVSEGPGACLFGIRNGVPITPDFSQDILESITRDTLLKGFGEWMGLKVEERAIGRSELYACEEVFFCGSGQEVLPVVNIDGLPIGSGRVGPITAKLQKHYFDVVSGRDASHPEWRTAVYA